MSAAPPAGLQGALDGEAAGAFQDLVRQVISGWCCSGEAGRLQSTVMDDVTPNFLCRLKLKILRLRREVLAMYLAIRHPATPWYAKVVAAGVVAYALSPLDIIPDPIPVLGYLDDLVIVPLGILVVRWMIPSAVLGECRHRATEGVRVGGAWLWAGGLAVGGLWLLCIGWLIVWGWRWFGQ